jgi:hypothetical protein
MVENVLFPGRPNYNGPVKGWFSFLHHQLLCEYSHNVYERIGYICVGKPKNEIPIRLHNMMYLGDSEALARLANLYDDWKAGRAKLDPDNSTTQATAILAYIKLHIPNCAWDGEKLMFP